MQISHELALIKLKLFGKQNKPRIIFDQERFTHARLLLKTINVFSFC